MIIPVNYKDQMIIFKLIVTVKSILQVQVKLIVLFKNIYRIKKWNGMLMSCGTAVSLIVCLNKDYLNKIKIKSASRCIPHTAR